MSDNTKQGPKSKKIVRRPASPKPNTSNESSSNENNSSAAAAAAALQQLQDECARLRAENELLRRGAERVTNDKNDTSNQQQQEDQEQPGAAAAAAAATTTAPKPRRKKSVTRVTTHQAKKTTNNNNDDDDDDDLYRAAALVEEQTNRLLAEAREVELQRVSKALAATSGSPAAAAATAAAAAATAGSEDTSSNQVICSNCDRQLPKSAFSGSQLKKTVGRKCKKCVDSVAREEFMLAKNAAVQLLPEDEGKARILIVNQEANEFKDIDAAATKSKADIDAARARLTNSLVARLALRLHFAALNEAELRKTEKQLSFETESDCDNAGDFAAWLLCNPDTDYEFSNEAKEAGRKLREMTKEPQRLLQAAVDLFDNAPGTAELLCPPHQTTPLAQGIYSLAVTCVTRLLVDCNNTPRELRSLKAFDIVKKMFSSKWMPPNMFESSHVEMGSRDDDGIGRPIIDSFLEVICDLLMNGDHSGATEQKECDILKGIHSALVAAQGSCSIEVWKQMSTVMFASPLGRCYFAMRLGNTNHHLPASVGHLMHLVLLAPLTCSSHPNLLPPAVIAEWIRELKNTLDLVPPHAIHFLRSVPDASSSNSDTLTNVIQKPTEALISIIQSSNSLSKTDRKSLRDALFDLVAVTIILATESQPPQGCATENISRTTIGSVKLLVKHLLSPAILSRVLSANEQATLLKQLRDAFANNNGHFKLAFIAHLNDPEELERIGLVNNNGNRK